MRERLAQILAQTQEEEVLEQQKNNGGPDQNISRASAFE